MCKQCKIVYWADYYFNKHHFYLAATDKGLCYILLPNRSLKELEKWVTHKLPETIMINNQSKLSKYVVQLDEYFNKRRRTFDFSLDLVGTKFQKAVWKALLKIPYGTTKSYSQIAKEIGCPKATRAVGAANGANPIPIVVPCHRVIAKDGTLGGYGGGLEMKKELLSLEGIEVFCD
ncbi:MAG TPA: methylated-DNA--[protein]-cysteine S-methyltransferase [Thermoanaerobacterales bacterium]|jgi:methylated-DNA-[protein]-cysteine S-methyltransferase|nr:methylated-DNA--[protein]-cysteine S-methyltransferase [Thermoanaerobacterales bacterium]